MVPILQYIQATHFLSSSCFGVFYPFWMARPPENGVKKGPWSIEEDRKLIEFIEKHGQGNWQTLPKQAGLNRCGKSCRLRWTNYLRPGIKRGGFSAEEEATIIALHKDLGNKWSRIAAHLPRRTDNEIKNFWNTHLRKKLLKMGIDPKTHKPIPDLNLINHSQAQLLSISNLYNFLNPNFDASLISLQANANNLIQIELLQNILQVINPNPLPYFQRNLSWGDLANLSTNIFPVLNQQLSSSNSLPSFDGEIIPSPVLDNYIVKDSSIIYNSEYSLPSLVSETPESYTVNPPESFMQSNIPTEVTDQSNVLDSWEIFVDDEASNSLWKDILG
ncbi:hypothetical protein ACH5RR_040553 [Cinchona calisaya]|uniref:Uncharacterized protein n=1 Tax=Cinchona calisaya TaxID=153742 RepID=A0ABD2XT82_9GENT